MKKIDLPLDFRDSSCALACRTLTASEIMETMPGSLFRKLCTPYLEKSRGGDHDDLISCLQKLGTKMLRHFGATVLRAAAGKPLSQGYHGVFSRKTCVGEFVSGDNDTTGHACVSCIQELNVVMILL